jgi:hypothetical protein
MRRRLLLQLQGKLGNDDRNGSDVGFDPGVAVKTRELTTPVDSYGFVPGTLIISNMDVLDHKNRHCRLGANL